MIRLYKPARAKECGRGYFSYLTEAVGNLVAFYENSDDEAKVFFDLCDVPGYGKGNMFDAGFLQDHEDYRNNEYSNLEDFPNVIGTYISFYDEDVRRKSKRAIEKHFVLKKEILDLIEKRFEGYDFKRIIGVHRRSTDIVEHHGIVDLTKVFEEIDKEDYDYIFLATDTNIQYQIFKERYGDKILFFDKTATDNNSKPFFKIEHTEEEIEEHIKEMVFTVYALARTKKLICSRSNIPAFSILLNPDLPYVINT
jgi:hypothetical protein